MEEKKTQNRFNNSECNSVSYENAFTSHIAVSEPWYFIGSEK